MNSVSDTGMNAQNRVALPDYLRRRSDIIGLSCALVCFRLSYSEKLFGYWPAPGPSTVVLPMIVLSCLAGFVGSILGRGKPGALIGCAPRAGTRAAIVAALFSGAFTVLAATLFAFGIGSPAFPLLQLDFFGWVLSLPSPAQVLAVTLVGIPPSAFFGVATAMVTATFRIGPISDSVAYSVEPTNRRARRPMNVVGLMLLALAYLSPLALLLRPTGPSAPPESGLLLPRNAPPVAVAKWTYEKPSGIASADATQLVAVREQHLGRIDSSLPVAMSPNGARFAACRRERGIEVQIWDLNTAEVVGQFSVDGLATLSWSPDSRRLFCTVGDSPKMALVIDVDRQLAMPLPQPKDSRMPEGLPDWWDEEEVMFVDDDEADNEEAVRMLNLDTLRVHPASTSPKWIRGGKDEQMERRRAPRSRLAVGSKWALEFTSMIVSYEVPINEQAWKTQEQAYLGVQSAALAYCAVQPSIPLKGGDAVAAAVDGTKAVRIRENVATAFYFGVRDAPHLGFRVLMPLAPDATLSEPLKKGGLCAFICSPLVNPLNGKTVGPNRERVKAIARVSTWKDFEAEFWIDRAFLPIEKGDVMGDLHVWKGGEAIGAGDFAKLEWFTVLPEPLVSILPPSQKDFAPLDRGGTFVMYSNPGASLIGRFIPYITAKAKSPTVSVASSPPTTTPPQNNAATADPSVERTLTEFLRKHHEKSSRGDVQGVADDFSDLATYMNHGVVLKSFIWQDLQNFHREATWIKEGLANSPTFRVEANGRVKADYLMSYSRQTRDRKMIKGIAAMDLWIHLTPFGPRIIEQHIKIRSQDPRP